MKIRSTEPAESHPNPGLGLSHLLESRGLKKIRLSPPPSAQLQNLKQTPRPSPTPLAHEVSAALKAAKSPNLAMSWVAYRWDGALVM